MVVKPDFRKYIIVVMGSSQSGVTSFINCISELEPQTVPDPIPSPTLKPLDYGRLTVDFGHVIYLYGLSEENPVGAWTFLFDRPDPIGVIAVVDSTRPETFEVDKTLIKNIDLDIPFVIAANKQDCAEAWDLDAVRIALNLSPYLPIIACSATTGEGIQDTVLMLFERLSEVDTDDDDDPL